MTSLGKHCRLWPGGGGGRAGQRVGGNPAEAVAIQPVPHHKPRRAACGAGSRDISANRIDQLGRDFDGRVGIAVRSIDDGWETGWKDQRALPAAERQQIVGGDHRARRGRQGPRRSRRQGHADPRRPHASSTSRSLAEILGRQLHDDARRPDVQGDHDQRQYRQRQADALGRRARRGARDDRAQASGGDPLRQRRARAAEQDRRPDLDAELFDRQRLLRRARRACRCQARQRGVQSLRRRPLRRRRAERDRRRAGAAEARRVAVAAHRPRACSTSWAIPTPARTG